MILCDDNIAALARMRACSVDAVVTDPPYGLTFMAKHWDYDLPSIQTWEEVLRVLKPGGHLLSFGGTRTYHRLVCGIEDAGFEIRDSLHWLYGSGFPKSLNVGDGRGTALKPAHEPIVLARKPLEGTVAGNLARWGTGALNIDACRVASEDALSTHSRGVGYEGPAFGRMNPNPTRVQPGQSLGRWPPNVLLTHSPACEEGGACHESCPVAALDAQSGVSGGGVARVTSRVRGSSWRNMEEREGDMGATPAQDNYGDRGGASRFYPTSRFEADDFQHFIYQAKAARSEREQGCGDLPTRTGAEAVEREEGTDGLKSPRAGAGRTASAVRNHHPTVKPVSLMRWCVRLVARPGMVVLDPFAGSGTTNAACAREDVMCVGIEREAEYATIAEAREQHALTYTTR